MKFTKMQGIGNDYVYVDCFQETVNNPSAVAKFVSDRHFGIGSDGLILVKPSDVADCEMDMYNLDGSQGAMCGNGIRCVAKFAYDRGIVHQKNISVATKSGIKYLELTVKNNKVSSVKVNMGSPILNAKTIPVVSEKVTYTTSIFTCRHSHKKNGTTNSCVTFAVASCGITIAVFFPSSTEEIRPLFIVLTADMSKFLLNSPLAAF